MILNNQIVSVIKSFINRLGMIVRVNVVLNRTVVVDSDRRFDNLCGSRLNSESVCCITSVDGMYLWLLT